MRCVVALIGNIRLRLELTDPGFDASVLCEFRARLVEGEAEDLLLDALLTLCARTGLAQISWATTHRFDPHQPRKSEQLIG
jgi:hypothetical protein